MISVGDLKRSMAFELDGQLMSVIEWQHIKMGRGGAIVKVKMRNLRSGSMSRSVHLKQISNLTSGPCGIELDADLAGAHKR